MKLSTALGVLLVVGSSAHAATTAGATATIFAPGEIAGTTDDGAAAFTPDGATVYFMRGTDSFTLMESHRDRGHWSTPKAAPFSGHWRDLDPAMAPDGSFLLFVSNRPVLPGGKPIDEVHAGKRRAGEGMNLWRVNRQGNGWSAPVRLPDVVNSCSTTFAPSIAADGSIYFIGCSAADTQFHLLRSVYRDGVYHPPYIVKLGDADAQIRDPAIAPDRSFMVFSTKHDAQQPYRLAIAFHTPTGWSTPRDLGDSVNGGKHSMGAQLGADHRTLYFYSDRRLPASDPDAAAAWNNGADHIWQVSLAPWLDAPSGTAPAASRLPSAELPWGAGNDASPAFTPDGRTVVFARGQGPTRRIYLAHRRAGIWSTPERAPFSAQWMDLEPAMAPDGSYLVFISNRPATAGGKALDGYFGGKPQPGRGGNLWRVNRAGDGWSAPVRLPDIVNASPATYSPAVAADGSLYFMKPDPQSHHLRIYVSQFAGGQFQPPVRLPLPSNDGVAADVDPAIAPDRSFIVFSSNRRPAAADTNDLFVAFATPAGWGQPIHLGPSGEEARLDPDLSTVYFTAADNRIHHLSIAPWLAEHVTTRPR
ncbi:PD40 domain-containing protein [Rhodanobacter glycinis]|nr:PD40 domain-containing protein [Rhodanobacter glycinis]